MPTADKAFMATALERFTLAKSAWEPIRKQYNQDTKFVNMVKGQWDPAIVTSRENNGLPVLEFNELHTYVSQISNRARQERPQPKINPGDGGTPEIAEALEGKLRHIQYASQADVAYDNAVECSASGGYGFYRITKERVTQDPGPAFFHQEPRVRRILDPNTVYFDPSCEEADYSDAAWCFVRIKVKRKDYRSKYGQAPIPFDPQEGDCAKWGNDKEYVYVGEYWRANTIKRRFVQVADGTTGFFDELPVEQQQQEIVNEGELEERSVTCDVIDGNRKLESYEWEGKWIPIIPVLGRQVIVDGKKLLISAVRFSLDAQKLKNATQTAIAENLAAGGEGTFVGYKGQFKDGKWRLGKRQRYYEVEPTTASGQVAPLPTHFQREPSIQDLTVAAQTYTDDIKRSVGYVDNLIRPSQGDLSGVAVSRRNAQTELTNYHFQDNLVRSQWHAGRVMLDLYLQLTDTSRKTIITKADGTTHKSVAFVRADESGEYPTMHGVAPEDHHPIDVGNFDVTISVAPSYQNKLEEETELLTTVLQVDPALWPAYAPTFFRLKGYPELAEIADVVAPPQIQAMKNKSGIPPQVQAAMAQKDQMIQKLLAGLQQLHMMIQTKQVEAEGRLKVEQTKIAGQLAVESQRQGHDAATLHAEHDHAHRQHAAEQAHDAGLELFKGNLEAIKQITDLQAQAAQAMQPRQGTAQ